VADSARSRILDQVENGVAVRMAVLAALCGGQAKPTARPAAGEKAQRDLWT